ncbi:MAG: hypothetical protein KKG96_02735 [Proteobacteria bacterium]|nr:hypothetical protein [Pseudomonadota bacterium]
MVHWFAKYRVAAGRLLLVVLTGYAVMNLLWQNIRIYSGLPEKDPVTIHEERIRQLKPLLPASGEIGYITTVENDRIFGFEKSFTNVEFLAQYVLTQYTLAPRIVRNSPDLPLVVGNFIDGPPAPGFLEKHGLVPLRDLGDGLILYRKERKP